MKKILVLLVLSLSTAFADHEHGTNNKMTCFPQNNILRPDNGVYFNGISQEVFNSVLDRVNAVYQPIFSAQGLSFVINRLWTDETINASAQPDPMNQRRRIINMYGGLARHETITMDGFYLVACHEAGHHLGGAPKIMGWASNEGQSDYFATTKCLRKIFLNDNNTSIIAGKTIPATLRAKCSDSFSAPNDVAICIRITLAGYSVANLFKVLSRGTQEPSIDTPDTSTVMRTNDRHPATQCRLDTYFQGSICKVGHDVDVDNSDQNKGMCTAQNGHTTGLRPRCWYKAPGTMALATNLGQ